MIKITDIYNKLNEEKSEKSAANVNDLIKDDSKSEAAKAAILKKKWQVSSHDIPEVAEFKKKKLASELDKLKGVDESKVNEEEKDEYEEFFNMKLKKWNVKSPNELGEEDKKKFFDEIEAEWDKENESVVLEALGGKDAKEAKEIAKEAAKISDINKLKAFLKPLGSDSDDIKNFKRSRLAKEFKKRKGLETKRTKNDEAVDEKKACKKKKKEEEVDTEEFDKDKKINESVALGVLTLILVYSSSKLVINLIDAKKSKNALLKKINSETDPEKKKKLEEEYTKASNYEKIVRGDIIRVKEKIAKKKTAMSPKDREKTSKKLEKYQKELDILTQEEKELHSERNGTNESLSESEVIDKYTSKYFHFYEKMFALVDTKEKVDEIFESVFTKLTEEKEMNEAREALDFFRKYRLAELGLE